jgi:quercetin dioxygenase-like cupin family protein
MTDTEYPRVRVEEVPDTPNPTIHKKELDEALGVSAFGFNLYVARPGERLPWGYHVHPDHEEVLHVLEGELLIETEPNRSPTAIADGSADEKDPEDAFRIEAGDVLFVPPGVGQCARAIGSDPARVIAVGAPKDDDSAVLSEFCPTCDTLTDRTHEVHETDGETVYVLSCTDCDTETDRFGVGPD